MLLCCPLAATHSHGLRLLHCCCIHRIMKVKWQVPIGVHPLVLSPLDALDVHALLYHLPQRAHFPQLLHVRNGHGNSSVHLLRRRQQKETQIGGWVGAVGTGSKQNGVPPGWRAMKARTGSAPGSALPGTKGSALWHLFSGTTLTTTSGDDVNGN